MIISNNKISECGWVFAYRRKFIIYNFLIKPKRKCNLNLSAPAGIEAAAQRFRCNALTIELQNTVAERLSDVLEYILAAVLIRSTIFCKWVFACRRKSKIYNFLIKPKRTCNFRRFGGN
jgi:hypothetical protein